MESSQPIIFLPELDLVEAEQGDNDAQYRVGFYNRQQKNYTEAVKWLQQASNQGHLKALTTLAMLYETGEGVAQNTTEALKLYRKAAERGHAEAKNKMMELYQVIKTNSSSASQQGPVFINKPVITSTPTIQSSDVIVASISPAKTTKIIYEKDVNQAIPEESSSSDDESTPYSYSQSSQMWPSSTRTTDPNEFTRRQLQSNVNLHKWNKNTYGKY